MNEKELLSKIDTIFQTEQFNLKNKHKFYYDYISKYTKIATKITDKTNTIVKTEEYEQRINELKQVIEDIKIKKVNLNYQFTIRWETFEILSKLYDKIENDTKLKEIFIAKLIEIIIGNDSIKELPYIIDFSDQNYYDSASIAFYFLISNNMLEEGIDAIKKSQENRPNKFIDYFVKDIIEFVYYEPYLFNFKSLNDLKDIIKFQLFNENFNALNNVIIQINFLKLKEELKGIEEQIQDDKKEVINKIRMFGFPNELLEFLDQIDKALKLPDLGAINSGVINGMREFSRQLFTLIAKKISFILGEKIPHQENNTQIKDMRKYLKNKLNLSNREDELLNAYVEMLHGEGGHKMFTDRKYFQLLYNIGIELFSFLLEELKKFESQYTN